MTAPDTPAQQSQDARTPSANSKLSAGQQSASATSTESHARSHPAQQQQSSALGSLPAATKAYSGTQQADGPSEPAASPFAQAAADPAASVAPDTLSEHVQDAWVYRDPNWEVQGPFSKADILDWFEGGFFPADLPIRHASNPQADFKPLAAQIKIWAAAAPPGFARQEPQAAPTHPHTPAQKPPLDQQPLSSAASGHQMQQHQSQPQADIDRTYTLTTAGSNSVPYMGPNSASSARLDELETGSNMLPAFEPARPAAEPVGMDLIHMLTRGHSGASHVQSGQSAPGQGQDPLAQFTGLQQGLSAAAPWGHQAQTGSASSKPFDSCDPILGHVGSGLPPQDPFASRPFSQPVRQDPPQQHALPAFLSSTPNHAPDRSHSVHQDRGLLSQPFASHPQAGLEHLNLGAGGPSRQPQQQQQPEHQQASLWVRLLLNNLCRMDMPCTDSCLVYEPRTASICVYSPAEPFTLSHETALAVPACGYNIDCFLVSAQGGQQHAQSTAQLFGGMHKPEQQQQPQQGLSDFQKLLQQALPKQHQQHQSHQPVLSPQQLPAVSQTDQAVSRPQPSSKAPESPAASRQPPVMPTQQEPEPTAAAPKRKAAAPKKAAPGPAPQAAAAPTPAWAMPEQASLSLAGVQLEQQQQQQQLPDWGLSSEAPPSPKKAETKAPWGAAKPPVPG